VLDIEGYGITDNPTPSLEILEDAVSFFSAIGVGYVAVLRGDDTLNKGGLL
jgi:hypothetical protein